MAKKKKKKTSVSPKVAALAAALPDDIKVIDVPAGATVEADVDVNDMTIPYTIALDTGVVISPSSNRKESLGALTAGSHRVGWSFAHTEKGWKHVLNLVVNGKKTLLEQRSESAKDTDHSVGVAILVVS